MNISIALFALSLALIAYFIYSVILIKRPPVFELDIYASNSQRLVKFEDNKAFFILDLTSSIGELEKVTAFYCFDSNTFTLRHEGKDLDISSDSACFIGAVLGWNCEHYNCSCKECSPVIDFDQHADDLYFT